MCAPHVSQFALNPRTLCACATWLLVYIWLPCKQDALLNVHSIPIPLSLSLFVDPLSLCAQLRFYFHVLWPELRRAVITVWTLKIVQAYYVAAVRNLNTLYCATTRAYRVFGKLSK